MLHTQPLAVRSSIGLLLYGALSAFGQGSGSITTVAGTGVEGYNGDEIAATSAELSLSIGVATDSAGNIYIADQGNRRIRKITIATGKISTIAGTGIFGFNGDNIPATSAQLERPLGLSIDAQGNIYFTDLGAQRVLKINSSGILATIAGTGIQGYNGDGMAANLAELSNPGGVAVDAAGNVIIADTGNSRIRKVSSSGIVTTIAGTGVSGYNGDGLGTSTKLFAPQGLAIDSAGNIYFCDDGNQRIRELTTSGQVVTLAGTDTPGYNGDGPALSTKLFGPFSIALDSSGGILFADVGNQRIRRLSPDYTQVKTIAGIGDPGYNGDNIPASSAELYNPGGIALDSASNIYVADAFNNRVRKIISAATSSNPSVYYFADLAFAGGFQTTLTYINYSAQSVTCTTNFYSDAGQPLTMPFTSGAFSTRTDVLSPGGSIHDETNASSTAAVSEGWGRATCTGPVEASLLYRLYNGSGIALGEASVNAVTTPATKFVAFAQAASASTGVAYANPSATQGATVTIAAHDFSGIQVGNIQTVTLSPLSHGSSNINGIAASFTGSIVVTSNVPIVSLSLNAEAFPVFSSLPPGEVPAVPPAGTQPYYFSDLAFGGGYQTTLTYINYGTAAVACTTKFYGDQGAALAIPFTQATASTRTDVLAPGASIHDQTTANLTGAVTEGWAVATCSGPVQASLLYRLYNSSGSAEGEASVNAETAPTTEFATFAQAAATSTGIAYANPSTTQSASILITLYSSVGAKLGTHIITLGPLQHGSTNVNGTNAAFSGFVKITSSIPIISLSLNAEAFPIFSSLPPGDLPASTILVP